MSALPEGQKLTVELLTYEQIARTIDRSLLRPELTEQEIIAGIELAAHYHVASVCVKPCDVAYATRLLGDSDVGVGTVIGFPHGSSTTATKVYEVRDALRNGATELDMVLNIGWLCSSRHEEVGRDIHAVVEAAADRAIVKIILENAYLTDEQKVAGCELSEAAGAQFVKTSTGFAPTGSTLDDLRLMRRSVSPRIQIKAAGGVRTLDVLLEVLNVGVSRVGATATKTILDDFVDRRSGSAAGQVAGS